MRKFEILRYIKKFSAFILLFAIIGSCVIYVYGKSNQQYVATATIKYTNDGVANGFAPDGSKLDVNEIYSTTVIAQAMESLGLPGTPDLIRSRCGVDPVLSEDRKKVNEALIEQGEEVTYFPDEYEIKLVVDSDKSQGYARDVLDAMIESYFSIYTEKYVEHRLSLRPSSNLLENGYDYYQCIYMLDDDTKSMLDFLSAKKDNFPDFRSSVTGYSFNDLYEIYTELNRYELSSLYAQVVSGPQVKNTEYLKKALSDEIKASLNGEAVRLERKNYLKTLIDNFSEKNKDIMDYHYMSQIGGESTTDYILKHVNENRGTANLETTYDTLVLEYVALDKNVKEESIKRNDKQYFLDIFNSVEGVSSGSSETHNAIEADIDSYEKNLVKYYELVNDTSKELNRFISADYIRMTNSVMVSETINIKQYVFLAILFFLVVGVIGAIVIGRAADFFEYFLYIDKKTGLPNRERCDAFLTERAKALLPDNYSCFVFELSNLTDITRKFGYKVGNNILADFAGLLNACISSSGSVFHNNKGSFLGFMGECSDTKAGATLRVLEEQIKEYNNLNPDYAIEYKGLYATSTEEGVYGIRELISCAFRKKNK